MEWNRLFQLEKMSSNHLAQLTEHFGDDQKLHHCVNGIVQMSLKY